MAVICTVAMVWAIGSGALRKEQPATSTSSTTQAHRQPTTGLSISESDFVVILHDLYKDGKYNDLLRKTARINYDERDFSFCWEVLMLQSQAYRRVGSHLAAEATVRKLLKYAQKRPGLGKRRMIFRRSNLYDKIEGYWDFDVGGKGTYRHRPLEKTQFASFLLEVYKCVKKGIYYSPGTGKPLQGKKPVSDDGVWGAAKKDYARSALKHLDSVMEKLSSLGSTDRLTTELIKSLRIIDVVRTHQFKQANAKAVPVINAFIKRYEQVIEPPCKKSIKRVEKLRKRKFWPKHKFMTLAQRKAIISKIWNTSKQLYVTNYEWGAMLTSYSRRNGILPKVQTQIKKLADRRDKLEKSFVMIDEFVEKKYRTRSPSKPGSTARSKIPTTPW
jgi:hypothetical protein